MRWPWLPSAVLLLGGCEGAKSVLEPMGTEAAEIGWLFWAATAIGVAVLVLVTALSLLALFGTPGKRLGLARVSFVAAAGIALPASVLSGLLVYGFLHLGDGYARGGEGTARDITIIGKRWWWKVVYHDPVEGDLVSANELRLPLGRPVTIHLESDNVIHSFWAPRLAGKLDMVPGRTNVLRVTAAVPGISRGQCAEFCGAAHALMSFHVVVLPVPDFEDWLRRERAAAGPPRSAAAARGAESFAANGCGACHAIRGTDATGIIGPDLTHVGSRHSLAAAALPNDAAGFARWIADNQHVKPDNLMPAFGHLSRQELSDLAAYLDGLE